MSKEPFSAVMVLDAAIYRAGRERIGAVRVVKRFGTAALFCGFMLLFAGCGSSEKFRYRTTVEVETPNGTRTGSAVREVTIYTPPKIPMLGEDRGGTVVRGEAVVVDISPDDTLFVLMMSETGSASYGGRIAEDTFTREARKHWQSSPTSVPPVELWPTRPPTIQPGTVRLPGMARFQNLEDPRSITFVAPNQLEAAFGKGVRLKKIVLELTRDPVTNNIEHILPWINDLNDYYEYKSGKVEKGLPGIINELRKE